MSEFPKCRSSVCFDAFICGVALESSLLVIYVVIIALNICKVHLGSPTQAGQTIPAK